MRDNNAAGGGTGNDKRLKMMCYSFFLVIALVLFASAGVRVYRYFAADGYTASAEGVVTGVKVKTLRSKDTHGHRHTSRSYYPKFEFTVEGVLYERTGKLAYSKDFCEEGRTVTVLYDPNNPGRCCLKGDIPGYKTGLHYAAAAAAVGIVVLICGYRAVYKKSKP